jgi:hypothetical protein
MDGAMEVLEVLLYTLGGCIAGYLLLALIDTTPRGRAVLSRIGGSRRAEQPQPEPQRAWHA